MNKPRLSLRLGALLCCAILPVTAFAHGDEDKSVVITKLFQRAHPEAADREVIVQRIELEPGASAKPHVHPGMVTGYVVSGELEFQVAGEPLLKLKAGDTFFEPPGSQHLVARNTGKEKTVLVAFVINPKGQAVAQPLPPPAAPKP